MGEDTRTFYLIEGNAGGEWRPTDKVSKTIYFALEELVPLIRGNHTQDWRLVRYPDGAILTSEALMDAIDGAWEDGG